ncbi:MAG: aminodeoxychorismate synthase component I [Alphaproteobacteria bacterium]|nr:aminodeoxychorismate synthase component I [Alphaproteobacteria bacterium]
MTPFTLPDRALLMDDARLGGRATLFRDPVGWIEARDPGEAFAALARIDAAIEDGLWVAGAFGFELGYLLEPKLHPLFRPSRDPLLAVGLYRAPETVDGAAAFAGLASGRSCVVGAVQPLWSASDYAPIFARVRDYIAAGDIYQLNLTWPLTLPMTGDPLALLADWRRQARAGHAAILRLGDRDVLSFSPELFLASEGDGLLRTRPMKGTSARGADNADDAVAAQSLAADPKQRAENLMIVDLLRNDMARVCEAGSVRVSDLFTVETYPTLLTMTSGIEGRLRDDVRPSEILRALFPCGSVTGAPKLRAMEIIAESEPETRGFYCGAIGAIGPDLNMNLNVAIRTLVHENGSGALRMGVGGGLVHDSEAASEYAEGLLKARFATAPAAPFDLLETLRWSHAAGFLFLDAHLERIADAARYFLRPFDAAAIRGALNAHVAGQSGDRRVRLLVDDTGRARVESMALTDRFSLDPSDAPPMRLAIAETRLRADDPFTRHKTTRRGAYDSALEEARAAGADEAVLLNAEGRVADGSFMTIFVLRGGVLVTPPVQDGALPGILKGVLQAHGTPPVVAQSLSTGDLRAAEVLLVGNSVRGLRRATL